MGRFVGVFLALVAICVNEGNAVLLKRQFGDENYQKCYQKIMECSISLQRVVSPGDDFRSLIQKVDLVCPAIESTFKCLKPSAEVCLRSELGIQLTAAASVTEFLCTPNGKALLRNFQNSECYDDPSLFMELEGAYQVCTIESISSASSGGGDGNNPRCEQVNDITQCVVDAATRRCGQALGDIISGISSGLVDTLTGGSCSDRDAYAFLKRGLEGWNERSLLGW